MSTPEYAVVVPGYTHKDQLKGLSPIMLGAPSNTRVVMGLPIKVQSKQEQSINPPHISYQEANKLRGPYLFDYAVLFKPKQGNRYPCLLSEQIALLYFRIGDWASQIHIHQSSSRPFMRDDWAQTVSRKSNRRIYYPVGRQVIREIAHSGLHASSDIHYLIQRGLAGLLLDCNAADAEPLKYQEVVKCIDNIASQSDVSMRIVANYGDKLEVIYDLVKRCAEI